MKKDKLKWIGKDPRDIAIELATGCPSNKYGSISSDEWEALSPEEQKADLSEYRYENGMLIIEPTGHVSVGITEDGRPSFESVVPCPWGTPEKIERALDKAKESIYMQGYFITSTKLIRNEAFDKRGEKTTTQISFRTCKTEDEAKFVIGKVESIIERR